MIEIDVNCSEELWCSEIHEKVFSFKRKIHNWLKEGENGVKGERGSKSSGSRSKSSGLIRSTGSISSRMSSKEKAIQEKLRGAKLRTEPSFMKKKREAELQAESLRIEEKLAKPEARVKIYEQEKLEAKVQSEKLVVREESGKTRKYTRDGTLLMEQEDQRKNYVILRDRHQRDKKTCNKEGIETTATQHRKPK